MDGIRSHCRIGKLGNKANCIDNVDNAIKKNRSTTKMPVVRMGTISIAKC